MWRQLHAQLLISEARRIILILKPQSPQRVIRLRLLPDHSSNTGKRMDRNYYQYKVDHPSQHFMSFVSAKYEVAKRKWQGIDIEIYYDAKHHVNIEMMLDAVERSLAYYTENFGPYMHKQCRIIEFPRYAIFCTSLPRNYALF